MIQEASLVFHDWNYAIETWDNSCLTWSFYEIWDRVLFSWDNSQLTWSTIRHEWFMVDNWNNLFRIWDKVEVSWNSRSDYGISMITSPLTIVTENSELSSEVETIIELSTVLKNAVKKKKHLIGTPVVLSKGVR